MTHRDRKFMSMYVDKLYEEGGDFAVLDYVREVGYPFVIDKSYFRMPVWLLRLLHAIGLTNLSDEAVERYAQTKREIEKHNSKPKGG